MFKIHESHDDIPVTPNLILQLHRDLYRFSGDSHAGKWKDSDNVIAERTTAGELIACFIPTPAAETPAAVESICREYAKQMDAGVYDPLLVSLVFISDFVSIHPFNDGNGRMSRLLTLLLMHRSRYDVGKYISIEKEIERTKETYYEALAASSLGWREGESDYAPFVTYMLGSLGACYRELDCRFSTVVLPIGNEEAVRISFVLRQVSLTGSIPFKVALPEAPRSIRVDAMSDDQLRSTFTHGYREIGAGEGLPAEDALASLRKELFDE